METTNNYITRVLEDGTLLLLQKMMGRNYRISLGDEWNLWANYCYHDREKAHEAWLVWDGHDDPPEGWYKHVETARRRPDYTAASEIIAP